MEMPKPKRVGPSDVDPVTVGDVRIEAIHWGMERGLGQNGGYIAAFDAASGDELWTLRVYRIEYDPHLESDVQDIFIERIEPTDSDRGIEVVDERGRRYQVDLVDRSVSQP